MPSMECIKYARYVRRTLFKCTARVDQTQAEMENAYELYSFVHVRREEMNASTIEMQAAIGNGTLYNDRHGANGAHSHKTHTQ